MLFVPHATRASFGATKFTSLVDFELLKTQRASAPRRSRLRQEHSAARSSASSQVAGRRASAARTRGSVRRGYGRAEGRCLMPVVYARPDLAYKTRQPLDALLDRGG